MKIKSRSSNQTQYKNAIRRCAALAFGIMLLVAAGGNILSATQEETQAPKTLYAGFPPIKESRAYEQYLLRPQTELSKLIFLIDRFGEADLQVMYENIYYSASFGAKFCRMFLAIHYKQEAAEHWVKYWATTSFPSGKPIWLKLRDGSFLRARDVFLEELENLDRLVQAHVAPAQKTS